MTMPPLHRSLLPLCLCAAFAACGKDDASKPSAAPAGGASEATSKYAMPADPKDAISVLEAKKTAAAAASKKDVVVVGRIKDMTPGFAAFTLTDLSLKYCGEGEGGDDRCETPWDYCCEDPKDISAATIAVAVKEKGEVVALPKIPELRNADLVAVAGTLTKDKDDIVLEATGWHRRDRPKFGPNVKFP